MKILCVEYDKKGRSPVKYVIGEENIGPIRIRARYNPEIEYYLTNLDETNHVSDDVIVKLFDVYKDRCFLRL